MEIMEICRSNPSYLKAHQECAFEVSGFESEGYFLIKELNWRHLVYCGLKHKSNGNKIDIFAYPETHTIMVHKNNKKIKERKF